MEQGERTDSLSDEVAQVMTMDDQSFRWASLRPGTLAGACLAFISAVVATNGHPWDTALAIGFGCLCIALPLLVGDFFVVLYRRDRDPLALIGNFLIEVIALVGIGATIGHVRPMFGWLFAAGVVLAYIYVTCVHSSLTWSIAKRKRDEWMARLRLKA